MKKINIYNLLSIISYYTIIFCILILNWALYLSPKKIIICSTIILAIIKIKKIKTLKISSTLISIIILLFYVLINYIFTKNHIYFKDAFISHTIYPFFSILYILILLQNDDNFLKKKIYYPSLIIFNIYYLINTVIILKQIQNPTFMLRNFTTNNFYLDHITGLIGANGTAKLMLFNIICLLINMAFFNDKKKYIRTFSKFFFTIILIISCYISLFNDSRMYYFILLLIMLPFFTKYFINIVLKNIKKIMLTLLLILMALSLYTFNKNIHELVDEKIINGYLDKTVKGFKNNDSNGEKNKEERLILLEKAIEDGDGLHLGKGIGALPGDGGEYVRHFGLNDFNVRIYNGGIIFVILVISVYTVYIEKIIYNDKKNIKGRFYIFLILTILGAYTQIFTYEDKSILIALIAFMSRFCIKNNDNKKEGAL